MQEITMKTTTFFFEFDPDSTALMIACASGNLQLVKLLFDKGADPNIETKAHSTALMYAIYSGNHRIVQMLLEQQGNTNAIDDFNKLSTMVCEFGNEKMLEILLDKKFFDVNARDSVGFTPLTVACLQSFLSMVKILLKAQADPNFPAMDSQRNTPLIVAARKNCLPIVECLLEAKADPNLQDSFGITALFFAVNNKNFSLFLCLLNAHADPCIETSFGTSAFHLACESGLVEMVREILKKTKPDFRLSNGMTPLWSASRHGQNEVVDCLITENADPNIPLYPQANSIAGDDVLYTPLCAASFYGHLMVVKMLLKAKADPNLQLDDINTPYSRALTCAIFVNDLQIVDALLEANADPNLRNFLMSTSLHYACILGNLAIINRILKAKANPNVLNTKGSTPLLSTLNARRTCTGERLMFLATGLPELEREKFLKVQTNTYEVVDILLNANADPDIPNEDNITPLHAAAENGRTNVVARLLKANAKPNIQTITQGVAPLHYATQSKHLDTIKALLKGKADPDITDNNGTAPLHICCIAGSLEITEVLLRSKANPNILDDVTKATPLYYAVDGIHIKVLQSLVSFNADPNIHDGNGYTPLHIMCDKVIKPEFQSNISALLKIAQILLEAKANPNVIEHVNGFAPLHCLCCAGSLKLTKVFLEFNADPNIRDAMKNTPLHYAVKGFHVQVLQCLISFNADPNIENNNGYTPLHIMCGKVIKPEFQSNVSALLKMAQILLEAKANPNLIAHVNGIAPLHCIAGSLELTEVFLRFNADPNIRDANKRTPLHYAVDGIHVQVLQCLISSNADPNIQDENGYTPLHAACLYLYNPEFQREPRVSTLLKIVEVLLEAGSNPSINSAQGTALDIATRIKNDELIKLLRRYRIELN